MMIGPHQIEFHLFIVLGFQKSVIDGAFQKRLPIIPIPIENKHIDAMRSCHINPFFHYLRVIIHFISPQRYLWLIVSFETGSTFLNDFPLANTFTP